MKIQKIALELAQEAQNLDRNEITVLKRSGITAVNLCGTIACQSEQLTETGKPEVDALAVRDVFGDFHLHEHPGMRFGIMISRHVRDNGGDSFNSDKPIPNVKVGTAMAAIGFLEKDIDVSALDSPTELTTSTMSTSFHHGIDNYSFTTHRLGWKLQLNPEKCGTLAAEVLFKLKPGESIHTQ